LNLARAVQAVGSFEIDGAPRHRAHPAIHHTYEELFASLLEALNRQPRSVSEDHDRGVGFPREQNKAKAAATALKLYTVPLWVDVAGKRAWNRVSLQKITMMMTDWGAIRRRDVT